jgi:hypothetical protein
MFPRECSLHFLEDMSETLNPFFENFDSEIPRNSLRQTFDLCAFFTTRKAESESEIRFWLWAMFTDRKLSFHITDMRWNSCHVVWIGIKMPSNETTDSHRRASRMSSRCALWETGISRRISIATPFLEAAEIGSPRKGTPQTNSIICSKILGSSQSADALEPKSLRQSPEIHNLILNSSVWSATRKGNHREKRQSFRIII